MIDRKRLARSLAAMANVLASVLIFSPAMLMVSGVGAREAFPDPEVYFMSIALWLISIMAVNYNDK